MVGAEPVETFGRIVEVDANGIAGGHAHDIPLALTACADVIAFTAQPAVPSAVFRMTTGLRVRLVPHSLSHQGAATVTDGSGNFSRSGSRHGHIQLCSVDVVHCCVVR